MGEAIRARGRSKYVYSMAELADKAEMHASRVAHAASFNSELHLRMIAILCDRRQKLVLGTASAAPLP